MSNVMFMVTFISDILSQQYTTNVELPVLISTIDWRNLNIYVIIKSCN